jgi:hypothetical protein
MERLRCKTVALLAKMAWPIWIAYAIAWSLALLTPQPIHVRDAVLSEQPAIFSSKLLHVGGYLIFTILSGWLRLPWPFRWCSPFCRSMRSARSICNSSYRNAPLRSAMWGWITSALCWGLP